MILTLGQKKSRRVAQVLFPVILILAADPSGHGQRAIPLAINAQTESSTAIPDGWYVYPKQKLDKPDQNALRCFNYSNNEWQVTSQAGAVQIKKCDPYEGEKLPRPPRLKHEKGMTRLTSSYHCNNNWLLGFARGEFGGALFLTNEDGTETKLIISENIRAIIPMENRVLVLSGGWLSENGGYAFVLANPDNMNVSLERATPLDGEPCAYEKQSDGSVLVLTTISVSRITKSGDWEWLVVLPMLARDQGPDSIAATADGNIYIGMRMFVLRLRKHSGKLIEDWLLPNACRNFALHDYQCVCKP